MLCCSVSAATRQLLLHWAHFGNPNVPFDGTVKLARYYSSQHVNIPVKAYVITHTLRIHAAALESVTGIALKNLSTQSLLAGGAWLSYKVVATLMLLNSWRNGKVTP